MAEKLETFPFKRGGRGGAGGSMYDPYLDGGIYRLVAPQDMTSASSAVVRMRLVARKRGMKLRTSVESESVLVVQAYTPEEGK